MAIQSSSRRITERTELLHNAFDELRNAGFDRGGPAKAEVDALRDDAEQQYPTRVAVEEACPRKQIGNPDLMG